jgi:hypothetical protein
MSKGSATGWRRRLTLGLRRTLPRIVGETPARYVAQMRMHHESKAAFSRACKRIIGVAPREVRASHLAK